MTAKVGPKGQVVIPKRMRDEWGLAPGTSVDFARTAEGVVVFPAVAIGELRGSLAGTNVVDILRDDRRRERESHA